MRSYLQNLKDSQWKFAFIATILKICRNCFSKFSIMILDISNNFAKFNKVQMKKPPITDGFSCGEKEEEPHY